MKIQKLAPQAIKNENTNNDNKKNNVAFKGKFLDGIKPSNLFDLNRQGSMGGNLFILNAFVFLLSSRILTSRDKDERREIFIRDIPTIVLAVMGVPMVEKGLAGLVQKQSGFAITKPGEKAGKLDTVSYSQLEDWYKYDKTSGSGLEGFTKRLKDLGGDVKRIFSSIDDVKVQEGLKNLKDVDTNEKFVARVLENKELAEGIKNALSGSKNSVLKKAQFLKTIPTISGFAATLLLIGVCIPKLNIFITESLHKNKKTTENDKSKSVEKAV